MTDDVRDSYNAMAELYAAVNLGGFNRATPDRKRLAAFAELAARSKGAVADLGCGPGHVVNYLSGLGLEVFGYDISPGQLAQAHQAFPDLRFEIGDLTSLDNADSSLGGIVARYSLIHMLPAHFESVFAEWFRVLEPGAPVLVSFFASASAETHGSPFDHAVVTGYALFPATIAQQLQDAGFGDIEVTVRGPLKGERALDHGTILAIKANPLPLAVEST